MLQQSVEKLVIRIRARLQVCSNASTINTPLGRYGPQTGVSGEQLRLLPLYYAEEFLTTGWEPGTEEKVWSLGTVSSCRCAIRQQTKPLRDASPACPPAFALPARQRVGHS